MHLRHALGAGLAAGLAAGVIFSSFAGYGAEPAAVTPPSRLSTQPLSSTLSGRDPIEGFNRTVFYVNDFFIYYIYRPVGMIYGAIMPREAVVRINNITDNVEFPRRFLALNLEGRFGDGGMELVRFLTNTTLGVAGMFDPAQAWFGITTTNEDFGQAFASWGIGPGCALQLDSMTNVRDATGMLFDYAADIKSYFYGGQAFTILNRGLDRYGQYDAVRRSTFDSYQAMKDYSVLMRALALSDWRLEPPPRVVATATAVGDGKNVTLKDYYSQGAALDTLRVMWLQPSTRSFWTQLSPWNDDFAGSARDYTVAVGDAEEKLSYRCWRLKGKPTAPLLVILPGLGAHATAATAAGLAELAHENGQAVLVVSNVMHPEFVAAAGAHRPPGYTPRDSRKLRTALDKVLADYRRRVGNPEKVRILGYSHGGLHALYLADLERREKAVLKVDAYLAINPPVDLAYALTELDDYFRSLDDRNDKAALAMALSGMGGVIYAARTPTELVGADGKPGTRRVDQVAVKPDVAKFLIGYSFRRTLEDLLVSMHHHRALKALKTPYRWGNRQALYDELANWNYRRYCETVLMPDCREETGAARDFAALNAEAGLAAIRETLAQAPNIRVFHNADDFLLTAEHRRFLSETLGARLTVFANGGHLGNLYCPEVRQRIADFIRGR